MKQKITLFVAIVIFALFLAAVSQYEGNKLIFSLFSLSFNVLLFKGFYRQKFYFESFISAMMWLGFWLKMTIHIIMNNNHFLEATGNFNFSAHAFDRVLCVSSVGCLGLLSSIFLISFFHKYKTISLRKVQISKVSNLYEQLRKVIFILFALLVLAVAFSNFYFGIYQRGSVSHVSVPFFLKSALTWLLLSGLAVGAATLIYWEILFRKSPVAALILSMYESLLTNMSMMSRGFVLNTIPQIWATYRSYKMSFKQKLIVSITFIFFMTFSIGGVGALRVMRFSSGTTPQNLINKGAVHINTWALFIDRWVGVEGVMSVSSYPNLGWDLWKRAWQERPFETGTSFYDKEIGKSYYSTNYSESEITKYHLVTLPGIVAFLYYPGSFIFLFLGMLVLTSVALICEIVVQKLAGNPILTALFAESMAYRLMHFGYLPQQAHMYFVAFGLNIILVAGIQHYFLIRCTRSHRAPNVPLTPF